MWTYSLMALTHVASQLMQRWLTPPPHGQGGHASDAPSDPVVEPAWVTHEDAWLDLVRWERRDPEGALPWLVDYLFRYDPSGERLCQAAARHFTLLRQARGIYLPLGHPFYPPLLRQLPDPPLALSLTGDLSVLEAPLVSVVGSRQASPEALRESYDLGQELARVGVSVVSGGAYGCDIAAHLGVLASDRRPAPAVCVFAGGLGRLYPKGNEGVFEQLHQRGGVLLSERLWEADSRRHDFPARNRLIAGLSGLTVVMQAAQRSGALITARLALEQGRDLAVLTPPAFDVRGRGSAQLIEEGAPGFDSARALAANLAAQYPGR